MTLEDEVLLTRLQSCHHPSLHQYLHGHDPAKDLVCPLCCLEEQDLMHWLCDCPAGDVMRQCGEIKHKTISGCGGMRKGYSGQP